MFETLSILPLAFWAVVALLIGGAVWAIRHMHDASGLPMLTVLGSPPSGQRNATSVRGPAGGCSVLSAF